MSTDPSFTGVRKASYEPNADDSAASGEPKVLNYHKHDSTRETTKMKPDQNANLSESPRGCRVWWTRPKIIVAAVALAIIVVLIIVLPSVLVTRKSAAAASEPSNLASSKLAGDFIYARGNLTGRITPVSSGNTTVPDFLDFLRFMVKQRQDNTTSEMPGLENNTAPTSTLFSLRFRRGAADWEQIDNSNQSIGSASFESSTPGSNDEEMRLVQNDLSQMLWKSSDESELCQLLQCRDLLLNEFAISHSLLYTSFSLALNRSAIDTFHFKKEMTERFNLFVESQLQNLFASQYNDYRLDSLNIQLDFDGFCSDYNLSCFTELGNFTLASRPDDVFNCLNSSDVNCTLDSTYLGPIQMDQGEVESSHNDSIVGGDILIVRRNMTNEVAETEISKSELSTTSASTTVLPIVLWPTQLDNCSKNGYICSNQRQRISTSKLCNGIRDCEDGSDEEFCSTCLTSFKCPSVGKLFSCISGVKLCDKNPDCPSSIDESPIYCKARCNPGTEFKCKTAEVCLPMGFVCDGDPHCPNGEDEEFCQKFQCQKETFFCSNKCLPKWKRCDGHIDCTDGSDEADCTCFECSSDETVLCHSGRGRCIRKSLVCNGVSDCPDGEDEINCPGWCQPENLIETISCQDGQKHSKKHACAGLISQCEDFCPVCDNEVAIQCGQKCVHRSKVCDGIPNCQDGSDEKNCSCFGPNTFICTSESNRCINPVQVCDGIADCNGGEDEQNCSSCTNNPKGFYCEAKRMCFTSDHRCNGKVDCPDYSDEDNCTCTDCRDTFGYTTFYCKNGKRCLSYEYLCKSEFNYHCAGTPPEDQLWCSANKQGLNP